MRRETEMMRGVVTVLFAMFISPTEPSIQTANPIAKARTLIHDCRFRSLVESATDKGIFAALAVCDLDNDPLNSALWKNPPSALAALLLRLQNKAFG